MKCADSGRPRYSDVLVLGAGPAGCSAAIQALKAGFSVTLLESTRTRRRLPGETLHPGAEPVLTQLGIWDSLSVHRLHRHRGIWLQENEGPRSFEPYGSDSRGEWMGLQVDPALLRRIFENETLRLGARVVHVGVLQEPIKCNGKVFGVIADNCNFSSEMTIDATGRHGWLARKLGLVPESYFSDQRMRFGWITTEASALKMQPLFSKRKDGWNWIAPLGNGECAWVKLRWGKSASGIPFGWRIYRDCAGLGYFLAGDAACVMDPSAGSGTLRAMVSGIYAAHLITGVMRANIPPEIAIAEYRRWLGAHFASALKIYRRVYST